MTALIHAVCLAVRLCSVTDPATALVHAVAAQAASSPAIPPEILLSIAWHESRFDPTATSYVDGDGVRRAGVWRSSMPAGTGPRFCGVMQTAAGHHWEDCIEQRPIVDGYRRGAEILGNWMRAAHGDLAAALRGYGCGFAGMRGKCRRFDSWVLAHARGLGWQS